METAAKKSMISGNTSEGIDRISSLPDELSVLSKRWRYIWTTMPYLHFDIDQFWLQQPNSGRRIFYTPPKENFKDFYILDGDFAVDSCCHAATRRNVQEIVLEFTLCEPLELPICLATCESLQALKLNLPYTILKLPNHFGFRQLKLLHLEDDEFRTNIPQIASSQNVFNSKV
ncbi:hypothetical protein H5410_012305 [Solanum commersonii]|uniref:Uncharacterized protein n=1 Tax=Solanum commersonii TaxID=4109 RepID=A0A9J6ASI2_SOLCO|nr:hypothetical protein H5410_012305 [Solanum commersonii]